MTKTSGSAPIQRTDGLRWLHVILSPLNASVVVWFADVTRRRPQQQALQDADRRKDEFLATLAHERQLQHMALLLDDLLELRDPWRRSGMRLAAQSFGPGHGSTVAVRLPGIADTERLSESEEREAGDGSTTGGVVSGVVTSHAPAPASLQKL